MTEITQIVNALKRQLKAQGMTYRDLAKELDMSEAGVKRLFASERFTLERLAQISQLLGFTMAEIMQEASASIMKINMLTHDQEAQLVKDPKLLLITVCILNHWSIQEIESTYDLSQKEIFKRLMVLDRIGMIELLPANRIRLRVKRDFDWLQKGPIRQFFFKQGINDFLSGNYDQHNETLEFAHAMLTEPAINQFQIELRRLKNKLASLHEECIDAPLSKKRGTGLLVAMKEWEFDAFKQLRK
ncbi:helix-turn-helix domain-containing protein [Solimicrobium silvestre]|uniref:HTH cro/C1-type domain-containing protein n=1 Tax=Solimicrobium silvestre TaxID=2099400 RepID=A0A2S9H254_9BURK|nr:helix-turn-helix transcriptional regulator [Solimicrobium silvestre]PRC94064.1 hypothetical protein S2091_1237 [Solimicrobium silvestre]